jgi:hypothetical protein
MREEVCLASSALAVRLAVRDVARPRHGGEQLVGRGGRGEGRGGVVTTAAAGDGTVVAGAGTVIAGAGTVIAGDGTVIAGADHQRPCHESTAEPLRPRVRNLATIHQARRFIGMLQCGVLATVTLQPKF